MKAFIILFTWIVSFNCYKGWAQELRQVDIDNPTFEESSFLNLRWIKEFNEAKEKTQSFSSKMPAIAVIGTGLNLEIAEKEGILNFPNVVSIEELSLVSNNMYDGVGHETGIFLQLSAQRNQYGLVGLIPEANVYPIKIIDIDILTSPLPFSRIKKAFELAKNLGVKLINFSLSCTPNDNCSKESFSNLLKKYKDDFLVVAAAGESSVVHDYGNNCQQFPICLEAPNLIKVGAHAYHQGQVVKVTKGNVIDTWAYGHNIIQWRIIQDDPLRVLFGLDYANGSSHATPIVVAAGAIAMKVNPLLSPNQLKEILVKSTELNGKLNHIKVVENARNTLD